MPEDMGNVLSGYPAKPKRCDRFQVHSIPKETMKKVFGIETKHIGYSGQTDSFRRNKLNSAERNQPCGVFGGPGGPNPDLDKYKIHSIPKETMKKVFGIETSHIGYAGQGDSFRRNKLVSTEKNQPCGMFAGPGGPNPKLDKYQLHSIPKETMKKVFGIETSHIGYMKPESSFRYKKMLSSEVRQPCSTFGDPQGPDPSYERMKHDSLPKEVMKKVWGLETKEVPFRVPKSSFRYDVGVPFAGKQGQFDEKCKAPKGGDQVIDDYFWRMRLKGEFRAQCEHNASHGLLRGQRLERAKEAGLLEVPKGVHERAVKFNAARRVCSTREGREMASTLSNLDRKLQSARGGSRSARRGDGGGGNSSGRRAQASASRKQEALQALKTLCDKMQTLQGERG